MGRKKRSNDERFIKILEIFDPISYFVGSNKKEVVGGNVCQI